MERIKSDIPKIRAIEDTVRATKNYTEGLFTASKVHPEQDNFPTRIFTKQYDIYPDSTVPGWDSYISEVIKWLRSRVIVIKFWYDYRNNKAEIIGQRNELAILCEMIPNFQETLEHAGFNINNLPKLPENNKSPERAKPLERTKVRY